MLCITQPICDSKNISSKRDAIHKFKLRVISTTIQHILEKFRFSYITKKMVLFVIEANIHRKVNINHKIVVEKCVYKQI